MIWRDGDDKTGTAELSQIKALNRNVGERYIPCESHEDRPSTAVIILRLVKKLDDILANSFEIAFLTHLVYLF